MYHMTRKAARKRRRDAAKRSLQPSAPTLSSSWRALGTLVASTAITGLLPASASAHEFVPGWSSAGRPKTSVPFSLLQDGARAGSGAIDMAWWSIRAQFRAGANAPQSPPAAPSTVYQLDIPPAPLADVISAFERVTQLQVTLVIDSIGSIPSPGVSGGRTVEQALEAILAGTNVRFRLTSSTSAVLELAISSESVEVTGRAPVAVVSSPKYTAPLRDIPQTIEVIPRAAMEAQGVTTLSEALRNVPGITLQAGEGGGASSTAGDMFNMRGFNASNSLFVDNVRDDGLVSRDVFNLEQVEVFMGPTGSDVGRGTAAGYVNMQTKTPHLPRVTLGDARLRHARSSGARTFDLNQPLRIRRARQLARASRPSA